MQFGSENQADESPSTSKFLVLAATFALSVILLEVPVLLHAIPEPGIDGIEVQVLIVLASSVIAALAYFSEDIFNDLAVVHFRFRELGMGEEGDSVHVAYIKLRDIARQSQYWEAIEKPLIAAKFVYSLAFVTFVVAIFSQLLPPLRDLVWNSIWPVVIVIMGFVWLYVWLTYRHLKLLQGFELLQGFARNDKQKQGDDLSGKAKPSSENGESVSAANTEAAKSSDLNAADLNAASRIEREVRLRITESYVKSWWFRVPILVLTLAAVFALFGSFQLATYTVDLTELSDRAVERAEKEISAELADIDSLFVVKKAHITSTVIAITDDLDELYIEQRGEITRTAKTRSDQLVAEKAANADIRIKSLNRRLTDAEERLRPLYTSVRALNYGTDSDGPQAAIVVLNYSPAWGVLVVLVLVGLATLALAVWGIKKKDSTGIWWYIGIAFCLFVTIVAAFTIVELLLSLLIFDITEVALPSVLSSTIMTPTNAETSSADLASQSGVVGTVPEPSKSEPARQEPEECVVLADVEVGAVPTTTDAALAIFTDANRFGEMLTPADIAPYTACIKHQAMICCRN